MSVMSEEVEEGIRSLEVSHEMDSLFTRCITILILYTAEWDSLEGVSWKKLCLR